MILFILFCAALAIVTVNGLNYLLHIIQFRTENPKAKFIIY